MQTHTFQDTVEWKKLTKLSSVIEEPVELTRFKRFSEALFAVSDEQVSLKIEFLRDAEYRYYLKGRMSVDVQLECQRCMSGLSHAIQDVEFEVYLVMTAEQEQQLPSELDALLVEGDELDLLGLIEDELLLQLPFTIFHEEIKACDQNFRYNPPQIDGAVTEKKRENPFKLLETLKKVP